VSLAPGDVFAGYRVVRQLGSGGMGAVYLVRHPRLPRLDALKLLRAELSTDPDFSRRFLREADVVAGLSHRNIVSVLDRGEHAGQLWLTMQYVDGIDAEQALADSGGLLPAERVAHIISETAAALDAAHRQHLIHRDVKPANILLAASPEDDEPEQVFLTDFGIAKSLTDGNTRLTRTGAVLATFDYASPEQIESRSPDARSDVYSLCCVLHRLLTGSVPYPGVGVAAAIHGHLQLPPPRPTALVPWLAPGIDDVVARAMAKDPAERFATCRAFAAAAASALADFPPPPRPPYTVTLSRPGAGPVLGPMTTDRLSGAETERLVELVRRTRFFDLPENLHEVAGRTTTGHRPRGVRPVTLEIRAGRSVRRVAADLAEARRPPALDALVETIQKLPPPPGHDPAPATVLNDLRSARVVATAPAPPRDPSTARPPAGVAPTDSRRGASTGQPGGPGLSARSVIAPPPPPPSYLTAPFGPAGPLVPLPKQQPTPAPARRRGLVVTAIVLLLLAAIGVTLYLTVLKDGDAGEPNGGSSSSTTLSPPEAALQALPRSADPLAANLLVLPRTVDGNTDLHLVDSTTGETAARLTTGPEADVGGVVSPDRKSIAFARSTDAVVELRVIAADGTGDSPLFSAPPADCARPSRPAWNPADPTEVALVCAGADAQPDALRLYTLDGATVRTLDTGHSVLGDLAVSADGTQVGYWAGDDPQVDGGDLYTLALDGSETPRQLTDVDGGADADMVWSNDGAKIAFRREVAPGERQIFVMNADGTDLHSITSGSFDQDPIFSPDDTQIDFKSDRTGPDGGDDHIWIIGVDGADKHQLAAPYGPDHQPPTWGRR
jgi:hypothetical protein